MLLCQVSVRNIKSKSFDVNKLRPEPKGRRYRESDPPCTAQHLIRGKVLSVTIV